MIFLDGGRCPASVAAFCAAADRTKPLLYIPFALEDMDYDAFCREASRTYQAAGFPEVHVMRDTDDLDRRRIYDYGGVFLCGGNTYRLLLMLRESRNFGVLAAYARSGHAIYGCSAGAVALGRDISLVRFLDVNDVGLRDFAGLDVLGGASVFPHYGDPRPGTRAENIALLEAYNAAIAAYPGQVLCIPERETWVWERGAVVSRIVEEKGLQA